MNIQHLEKLISQLVVIRAGDIDPAVFLDFVKNVKSSMSSIKHQLKDQEQLNQAEEIINYKTIDQLSFIGQNFVRYLSPDKYKWAILGWNRKGKYVYDLDQLELKLEGLKYKLEHQAEES